MAATKTEESRGVKSPSGGPSLLCVTEVAAAQGRHQQSAVLVPELNHPGVDSGDGLDGKDNECGAL